MNHRPRNELPERVVAGILIMLGGVCLWQQATGGEPLIWSWIAVALACLCALLTVLSSLWLWWRKQRVALVLSIGSLMTLLLASTYGNAWPIRLSYELAKSQLYRIASQVTAGERVDVPMRAGLFWIRRAEINDWGMVCLWTDLDPYGKKGFVHTTPYELPGNLWSNVRLDDHWQFVAED